MSKRMAVGVCELLVDEQCFDKAGASDFARAALISALRALHGVLPSVLAEWVRHALRLPALASLGEAH